MKENKTRNKCGTFNNKFNFYEWFVGYTDGDGCFNIYTNYKNSKISFTYKLSQKTNNIQVLYYMKKELGVGSVRTDNLGMSHLLIRDKNSIKNVIIPIFDKYLLQTSKINSYNRFKKCFFIWCNSLKTQDEKITEIRKIELEEEKNNSINLSKSWIIGFVEAEGSFYLTLKSQGKIVHGFSITQKKKNDKEVLDEIRKILKIKPLIRWNSKGFWILDTVIVNDVKKIKDYFFNTMKSRKSLIYRIWARSFRHRNKYLKLLELQTKIRKLK